MVNFRKMNFRLAMPSGFSSFRRTGSRLALRYAALAILPLLLAGCSHWRPAPRPDLVYVVAKETYLRDRVAAVSTRVALVSNGEALQVVQRGRRFLKVRTSRGEEGWIEDHLVIDQATYDQFLQLRQEYRRNPVVATGLLRDDLYLHLKPGRETARFYLLPENEKLQLLLRASTPKPVAAQSILVTTPAVKKKMAAGKSGAAPAVPAVPMEDWWLVRDSKGEVGWLLARMLDVDVPDEIAGYGEGQKIVGAYVLTRVHDPESNLPDRMVPEYLTVFNAYQEGLPYDFNQLRVFTWNVRKHRYETAYRERNIEGYLPVSVGQSESGPGPALPEFSIRVAVTGAASQKVAKIDYVMEGPIVKRITPPSPGETLVHPLPVEKRVHAAETKRRGRAG